MTLDKDERMRPAKYIDPEKLKAELYYDPDTGEFIRKVASPSGRTPAGHVFRPRSWDQYIHIKVDGQAFAAHRLAWVYMTGEQPDEIDHINGLRHDNRWANLRNGTHSDNLKNRRAHRVANGTFVPVPD